MKANPIQVEFENMPHLPLDRIVECSDIFSKQPTSSLAFSETGKVTYTDEKESPVNS